MPIPKRRAAAAGPSEEESEGRNTVNVNAETITNVTSTNFPGHHFGEDHAWDLAAFTEGFRVQFHHNQPFDASFSLIGLDASIANAFRRILIAEIPTLAIEDVFIENNTSVIQDEVLAHRLGLIPFKGSKDGIHRWMKWWRRPAAGEDPFSASYDINTVEMTLDVRCKHDERAAPGETDPTKLYRHAHVYARDLIFNPMGVQKEVFGGEDAIRPVNPDILVAKLRPGQAIELRAHLHLGVGADHAKFSPVATATYRLMPTITITQPILGADAEKFAECFAPGVIAIERVTKEEARKQGTAYHKKEGFKKAVVMDPMRDTVSREVLRHKEFDGKVKLGRRRDHFIFSVESTGQWDSDELFLESVSVLRKKCRTLQKHVLNMVR